MWIMPSSIKIENHPSMTYLQKNVFIIIWKVAGELVRPKNITIGLKSPSGVKNTAFHSSPGLIRMLLYPVKVQGLERCNVHRLLAASVFELKELAKSFSNRV